MEAPPPSFLARFAVTTLVHVAGAIIGWPALVG
jgi:hypothetical protein